MNLTSLSKASSIIAAIKTFYESIPEEVRDEIIDSVLDIFEKKNNTVLNIVCQMVRSILDVPDDDTNQQNPV